MRSLQRIVLVSGIVVFLFLGTSVVYRQKEDVLWEQWEQVLAERILGKVCRTGKITWADYRQLLTGLENGGVTGIEIEEYCREEDIHGKEYYYLVSWEEHKQEFRTEGYCLFEEGSIVEIRIRRKERFGESCNLYGTIVPERENDT